MFTFSIDAEHQNWICEGEPDSHDTVNMEIYFISTPNLEKVKNFKFDYAVLSNEVDVNDLVYDVKKRGIEANQDPIGPGPYYKYLIAVVEVSNLKPDTNYYFYLKASNLRKPWSREFEFTTFKSPSPYPSWVWDSNIKEWVPPFEKPDPVWDEASGGWVIP